ncbi:MAG TPA: hypothetical protein VGN72_01175 [Tepidisphaeraceae bacterium]|jgi:hypothetical protein|nr:hypothetical protein [Tepidisphaeraceae bacterium]
MSNPSPRIGDFWIHDGRRVFIVSGSYKGDNGCISNHWTFRDAVTGQRGGAYDNNLAKFHADPDGGNVFDEYLRLQRATKKEASNPNDVPAWAVEAADEIVGDRISAAYDAAWKGKARTPVQSRDRIASIIASHAPKPPRLPDGHEPDADTVAYYEREVENGNIP